tara:strand:+ start:1960 stop:2634 length:675 start_codon:yes stop_codon:yes gene_type:complete
MGFLKREIQTSVNPTSKFLEWKSNNKSFAYYDKETKQNVEVKLPITFIVLEEYHCIKGFSDSDQTGIYSNEVLQIGTEEMEVRSYKGRIIAKGLYKDIKGAVNAAGGNYHKSIYAVTKEGELINISLKGAAVSKWSKLVEKGAWKRLSDEWISIESAEDHKKGMVKYSTPNFVFNTSLSENEFKTVKSKATELENYLTTYFAKDVVVEDVAELDGVEALESLDF